jgi:hypothetical protein
MAINSLRNPVICAVVTLMITPHGTSQSADAAKTTKPREASSGTASGRDTTTGHASGRQDQFPKASGAAVGQPSASANARNSAHAVETLSAAEPAGDAKGGLQTNPLFESNSKSGENALHKAKDKSTPKSSANGKDVVTYKDPEDQTTRSHSGDNKK